jgi:RNA polymerase-binding transcription factor DksA
MSELNENTAKTRYSDDELNEFKELILEKLEAARIEFRYYQEQIMTANANGTDDTSSGYVTLEEGSVTMDKEHYSQLASRQRKFIDHLENALIRIENKTYGVCRETGRLIPKERLRLVPHATLSMEAKLRQ